MKIFEKLTPSERETAVALGNFDGVHLGHRKVISLALEEVPNGLVPTVLTFSANPLEALGGESGGKILSREEKIRVLGELGVEQLYLLDFETVRNFSAEEFVRNILGGTLRAKKACCGFNFTFGRGGTAGSEALCQLCAEEGIRTEVADAVMAGGTPVSSTRIRGLIENGRVEEAADLLGRTFSYESLVLHGRQLGRQLGTPTLNQAAPEGFVLPRFGVYVSKVTLPGGAQYAGVTNVGVKPTVGSDAVWVETWMPDYKGTELYGKTVRTELLRFLRPERRFAGLDELREAIRRDGAKAREFYRKAFPSKQK